jgi:general secretion pathway protein I
LTHRVGRCIVEHKPDRRIAMPEAASPRERGFTLIEVLVAVAIAALVLLPLLHGFSKALDGAADSEAYEEAVAIAQSALATLGTRAPLAEDRGFTRQDGRFTVAASVHRYPLGDASTYVVPYELSVAVSWGEGRKQRSVTLQTLRLGAQQ